MLHKVPDYFTAHILREKSLPWDSHVHEHTSVVRHPIFRQQRNNNWSSLPFYPQILYHEVSWHNVIFQPEARKSESPVKSASIHGRGGSKVFCRSFNLVLISRIININCLHLKIYSGGFLAISQLVKDQILRAPSTTQGSQNSSTKEMLWLHTSNLTYVVMCLLCWTQQIKWFAK